MRSCHVAVMQEDGNQYRDPSLAKHHESKGFRHHTDYDIDRNIFHRELAAARAHLISHSEVGGTILIIGLSFNPRFPEDLVSILSELNNKATLIYVMSSKKPLTPNDSELIYEFQKQGRDFIFINEISKDGSINRAVEEILARADESNVDDEWKDWINDGKWWTEVR